MSRSFRWRVQCALVGMFCAFSAACLAAERVIHVSVAGTDQAAGTLAEPLSLSALPERLQAVRTAQPDLAVRVELAAGDYLLSAPLHFTAECSGSETAPVLITATGPVRLSGGLPVTQWKQVREAAVLARLTPAAAKAVQVADLRAQGVAHFGAWCSRGHEHELHPAPLEVFCDNRPVQLARWPNRGWATTRNVVSRGEQTQLAADPPLTRRWQSLADVWCHGYWEADWSDAWQPVSSVDAQGRVTIQRTSEVDQVRNNARFCVLNVLEELDEPGEWYFERQSGRLYLWQPADSQNNVTISQLDHLVTCYGAQHITFRGLQFDTARVCLAEVAGGEQVSFADCTFRNAGNLAVHITGGYQHAIRQCAISDTGEGALRVEGGDRRTLTACEHEICDNHIQRYARTCHAGRPAIGVHGVGIVVRGNCIHDGPDAAIILQGNEHRIEGNDIHHVCLETADSGAIYLGHDWTERGNVVRGNCLHHLGRFNRRDVMGVYLDDFASGTTVTDNVFFDAGRAIVIGGGRDNQVHGNVVLGGFAAVQIDARGQTWARSHLKADSPLQRRLREMTAENVYLERYPQLAELLTSDPARPVGNSITHNVLWCAIGVDVHDRWSRQDVQFAANWHWPQRSLPPSQLAKANKPK